MTSSTATRAANVQRGKANGEKGKRAERAVVTWLRGHGFPGAERTVRTGHRVRARVSADRGDIDGTPGIVWQIKDVADRDLWQVPNWLAATEVQRRAAGADLGVLVVKRHGAADPGAWWAYVSLGDALHDALTWAPATPADLWAVPVRFALADLVPILRHHGYGDAVSDDGRLS